jgi:protein-S-isoprenylcysteine O-methyltransferase Ste14
MNKRRIIGNTISSVLALLAGVATLFLSVHYLAPPRSAMDWAVQLSGAATCGIIIFFLVWGHFQKTPEIPAQPPQNPPVKP